MQGGFIACQLDQFLSSYYLLDIKDVSFDKIIQGFFAYILLLNSFWKWWLEQWL